MTQPTHVATHHVWWDQPGRLRPDSIVRALCGRPIRNAEASSEPTCPDCLRALHELDGEPTPAPEGKDGDSRA